MALASCNQGTEEASVPSIVRNLFRLYVDTYECAGVNPEDDGVPCKTPCSLLFTDPSVAQRMT